MTDSLREAAEKLAVFVEDMFEGCEPSRGCTGCEALLKGPATDNARRDTRHAAWKAIAAALPLLAVPRTVDRPLLDREAVQAKIAEYFGAHFVPEHDTFYKTGVYSSDEHENAMLAYQGARWALELARPMPTRQHAGHEWGSRGCLRAGSNCSKRYLRNAGDVLALLGGVDAPEVSGAESVATPRTDEETS